MTITIELPAPVERRLAERAAAAGKSVETLVQEVVTGWAAGPRPFDEILAPFRQSVAESGMTDEELDSFFQEVRQEVWDEQQRGKP